MINVKLLKRAALPAWLLLCAPIAACGEGGKTSAAKEAAKEAHGDHAEHGAEEGGGHAEEEGGHEEEKADRVEISAEAAKVSDIGVKTAGSGEIEETIQLTGRIALQAAARAEIHAPYPGPVRAVMRNIGDKVGKGQALARVESAESLQTYSIASPISGIVLDRQVSVGDVTQNDPIFVVGDLTRLQAEFNVAPRDLSKVKSGQDVIVAGLDGATSVKARIDNVLPAADPRSQTLIARAPLSLAPELLRPGMSVRGLVIVDATPVSIAVPKDAVQNLEGRQVVFVRVANGTFEARPVNVGRVGAETVEITGGLKAGDAFVATNAFLVKAEFGKGSASHDH